MKNIKLIILSLLIILPASLLALPVIQAPTVLKGTCRSDAAITINATNLGPKVSYKIRSTDGVINTEVQSSNHFPGLPAGTYTLYVYDNTTGSTPVTLEGVVVTTSYVTFAMNTPVTVIDACGGSITLSATGGSYPLKFTIKNTTTNEVRTHSLSYHTYRFANLPAGVYYAEVEDACGEVRVAQASGNTTIANDGLANTPFTSLEFTPILSTIRGYQSCDKLQFYIYASNSQLTINGAAAIPYEYRSTIEYRIEYPINSGKYSAWVRQNDVATPVVADYNPNDPGQYRVQVKHPCSGDITSSVAHDMPAAVMDFSLYTNYLVYDDFCNLPTKAVTQIRVNSSGIYQYICNGFDIVATPEGGGEVKTYTWTGVSAYFTMTDLKAATKYKVKISSNSILLKELDINTLTPSSPASVNFTQNSTYYNYMEECNFATFDMSSNFTGNSAYSYNSDHPRTYTIKSGPEMRAPITVPSGSGKLWENLPYGIYSIEVDYGCRKTTQNYTFNPIATGFKTENFSWEKSAVCGKYKISSKGFFLDKDANPINNSSWYNYYVMEVVNLDTNAIIISNIFFGGSVALVDNLSPGRYLVRYRSYYSFSAIKCYYDSEQQTVVLPQYMPPTLHIAQSGGITCGDELGKLTINSLGDNPPFKYRFKQGLGIGESSEYSAIQDTNVFPNLPWGEYNVWIENMCGDVTKQPIKIYNGSQQFVGLVGSFDENTICQGKSGLVSVLSIGPVLSYKWFKDNVELVGKTGESIEIQDMQEANTGVYKVEVNTGSCVLSSSIDVKMLPVIGAINDSLTVVPFEKRVLDVFANDKIGLCSPQGCEQVLSPDKIKVEGYAAGVLSGSFGEIKIVDNKIEYTAPSKFEDGIVRFTYAISCEDNNQTYTDEAEVAIFILQSCDDPSVCQGESYTVCFKDYPAGKTAYEVKDGGTLLTLPHLYSNMSASKTLQVIPKVDGKTFPTLDFTIYVITEDMSQVRWKGARDHHWHNPANWVSVNSDNSDGAVINWIPTSCVDAEIPSNTAQYPKLETVGSVRNIYMRDRALLGASYKLSYKSATIDLSLKADEKNRWIMYSAPLSNMYSGDFMLRKTNNDVVEEAVYQAFYQTNDPDDNSVNEKKTISRPFANLQQKLLIGWPLFFKVDTQKSGSDINFTFPKVDGEYSYYQLNNWGSAHPSLIKTEGLIRHAGGRFISDEITFNPDYSFTLTSAVDLDDSEVIMVTNPFPSYLNIKQFLVANSTTLEQGYLIWDGTESSFIKYNKGRGNTWTILDVNQIKTNVPAENQYIAPYQSFFVVKKVVGSKTLLKFDPEVMNTIAPVGLTGDHKLK